MEQLIGEIRMFGGDYAPEGWLICDGSILQIYQYDMLYTLLGTTYGGNGQDTFGIPDLRGRVPLHSGNGAGLDPITFGQPGGMESVTLTMNNIPSHTHIMDGAGAPATTDAPAGMKLAMGASFSFVKNELIPIVPTPATEPKSKLPTPTAMNAKSVAPAGGSAPVSIMQPYLAVSYMISTTGVFPSQN